MINAPHIRVMSRADCDALLTRHHAGRLAFTFRDRVDIEPLHYVYHDGWLYGRTQPGAKIETLHHHPWVAFEVDEVEGLFRWRSVVVHGRVLFPAADQSPAEAEQFERATIALRELLPEMFTDRDPVPQRTVVFAIHADEVTGREATTSRRTS